MQEQDCVALGIRPLLALLGIERDDRITAAPRVQPHGRTRQPELLGQFEEGGKVSCQCTIARADQRTVPHGSDRHSAPHNGSLLSRLPGHFVV